MTDELMHAKEAHSKSTNNRDIEELKQWDEVVSKINKAVEEGCYSVDTGLNLYDLVKLRLTNRGYEVEPAMYQDRISWYRSNQYWE